MEKANSITFRVWGRYALFSDPLLRAGGEKSSYACPTYQALKGIMESCYAKPTIRYIVDAVRIMHPMETETKGIRPIRYGGGNDLSYYTYLRDVDYQVQVHFEWNENRPDLACDRNENKHWQIARRALERGGRRDIFLGVRECQGYIEPCDFGTGTGAYDTSGKIPLGTMFHSFLYPDENPGHDLIANLWQPVMENGVIRFIRPEDCRLRRVIRSGCKVKSFTPGENYTGVENTWREVEL